MLHSRALPRAILRDLGDGLILRRSTPEDAGALGEFNAKIHSDDGPDQPFEPIAAWTRDLLNGRHPTCGVDAFTIVEDAHAARIVSALVLIPQTWSYAGVEFGVGRPELVGTLPEYRQRGLVRAQFEVIHHWSAECGHRVQAITGIPWFYRQFGYEMGMELGGGRSGFAPNVPPLADGEGEPYRIRPAGESDLPFAMDLYRQASQRHLVTAVRDEAIWRYDLAGRSDDSVQRTLLCIVETAAGAPLGYLVRPDRLWGGKMVALEYELTAGVPWAEVTPSVIRYLWAAGTAYAARDPRGPLSSFEFELGGDHPVYRVAAAQLPRHQPPYAWYVRVPDLPGFLRHLAPVLERRLTGSIAAGHTGELKISFYRSGLRLELEQGRIVVIESWQPRPRDDGAAAFPDLTFLQLVFGYRSLEELRYAFADCRVKTDEARIALEALFPPQHSDVWPLG